MLGRGGVQARGGGYQLDTVDELSNYSGGLGENGVVGGYGL